MNNANWHVSSAAGAATAVTLRPAVSPGAMFPFAFPGTKRPAFCGIPQRVFRGFVSGTTCVGSTLLRYVLLTIHNITLTYLFSSSSTQSYLGQSHILTTDEF